MQASLFDSGFGFFSIIPFIVALGFLVIGSMLILNIIKGIGEWSRNNNSPRLEERARIVAKRTNVSHHHHSNQNTPTSSTSTTYYATFELMSGVRQEFHVAGNVFGYLVEGDEGMLSFQGTRYLGFQRDLPGAQNPSTT
jgi:hypothetical protein